jgi:hypothetical protein
MAKLERAIIGTLAAAAYVLIFLEARQISHLRQQIQSLQQQQRSAVERVRQLQQERDEAVRLQSALRCNDSGQSDRDKTELLRLRGEVAVLRAQLSEKLQDEKLRLAAPSARAEAFELGSSPKLTVNYDPALWKPAWSLSNRDPTAPQSMTWELDALGAGWLQVTVASHPDHIDEAQYREQLLARQTLRGEPAELVGERRETLGSREWTILQFRNNNTKSPRAEFHYFLSTNDGYVSAFVVGEEVSVLGRRANIETFLRQLHVD